MTPLVAFRLNKQFFPKQPRKLKNLFEPQESIVVCDDINFSLNEGELLGVVGPNGAGKTTLLRIMAGIILPDSGTVSINECDIVKNNIKAKGHLGIVFSNNNSFYGPLSGRENLRFFSAFYNLSRNETEKRIDELSNVLKIKEYLDKSFQEYSSGIKQRFALARGLLNDAPVLLLDEPTKNLDPKAVGEVRSYIRDELVKKKKKAILMISHLLSEVAQIADKVAIMINGRFKAMGTFEELKAKTRPADSRIIDFNDIYNYYVR